MSQYLFTADSLIITLHNHSADPQTTCRASLQLKEMIKEEEKGKEAEKEKRGRMNNEWGRGKGMRRRQTK